jgi:DNA-directed RNA polymerase subunit E'/Rpb7
MKITAIKLPETTMSSLSNEANFEQEKRISKTVEVAPMFLNKNIIAIVTELLKKKFEKTCDDEFGLLISIGKIIKMSNIISKDSKYVNFTVEFLGKTVKPEKGMVISFKPLFIISKGIFGKLYENINFFIPYESVTGSLKKWTFENDCFKRGKKKITVHDIVICTITDIMFETVKYKCICELNEM